MDIRGHAFVLDASDDEDEQQSRSSLPPKAATLPLDFVGDIQERAAKPPSSPQLKASSKNGFPQHKQRLRMSAFKQQRAANTATLNIQSANTTTREAATSKPANSGKVQDSSFEKSERQRIDVENTQRLADMTDEEIRQERKELLAQLDPALIERLLKRSDLDEGRGDTGTEPVSEKNPGEAESEARAAELPAPSSESIPASTTTGKQVAAQKGVRFEDDAEAARPPSLHASSPRPAKTEENHTPPTIHFPNASSIPDLDPSDPSFLENLHKKYYPDLPTDPSKLAWMAPIPTHGSIADQDSPYFPGRDTIAASALRFDFRGALLPPRIARAMPVTKGLHHHGEAPESAGYTVPELARLARSSLPSQRCLTFQTLGRLLYRLGRGDWGDENSEMTKGLWQCVGAGRVLDTLEQAAAMEGGHHSSKTYATEALWLWQKGGGKRPKAA